MKKNILKVAVAVVAIGSFALVPPLQSFAMDTLSIFRVSSLQTIKITVTDLQEGMQTAVSLKNNVDKSQFNKDSFVNIVNAEKPEHKVINNVHEFDDFNVNLPNEYKDEQPELNAVSKHNVSFTLKADDCNAMLAAVNSPSQLPEVLKTEEIGVQMPASLVAKYTDSVFFATQMPVVNASQEAKEAIKNLGLQLPVVPEGLRQQLSAIDVNTRDVYLPVLVGVGREVDLGGNTGYIYTLSDFKQFTQSLPMDMFAGLENEVAHDQTQLTAEQQQQLTDMQAKASIYGKEFENASVLIWTKDGTLYGLAGNKTDGELTKIARSVH